jgi:hypothetical protein
MSSHTYACFDCRKTARSESTSPRCPTCRKTMEHVGTKGRLPSPADVEGWAAFKVELDRRRRDEIESAISRRRKYINSLEKDIARLQLLDSNKGRAAHIRKLQDVLMLTKQRLDDILAGRIRH